MFDRVHAEHVAALALAGPKTGSVAPRRRTDDASWSPVIEIEHLSVDGAPALRHVHRMLYVPGHEIVMGHLLVPLRSGLFEARAFCSDATTGFRESALLLAAQRGPAGFLGARGALFALCLAGNTTAVPPEALAEDLEGAARTFRPLDAPAPDRPWWKIW